jgi:heme/copper-type cytochrome/quinol oxidase subunit 3
MSAPSPSPARLGPLVPSATLGMALFLATEAIFFTALISAFLVLRAEAPVWPPLDQPRLPVLLTALNTCGLLLSGWTMTRALGALRHDGRASGWIDVTALLGLLFLGVQGSEWARLIAYGLTTSSSLYGASFYALVGIHALHVVTALVALLVVRWRERRGHYGRLRHEGVVLCTMYWLFVVAVWPLLFVLVYLT